MLGTEDGGTSTDVAGGDATDGPINAAEVDATDGPIDAAVTGDGSARESDNADQGSDSAEANPPAPTDDRANWPMPNPPSTALPNPQNYDTSVAGVVRDNVTGLWWQQGIEPGSYTYGAAFAPCMALSLAGHSDWRLPTIIELISIVDFSRQNPAIDSTAFSSTPVNEAFWSSTLVAWNSLRAQSVNFGSGDTSDSFMATPSRVRCVRTPQPVVPSERYTVQGETVRDSRTKLTWQRGLANGSYGSSQARSYCMSLSLDGTGWRVPSMKELQTLIDFSRFSPAIDPMIFSTGANDKVWTSSSVPGNPSVAWIVDFGIGATLVLDVTSSVSLRCVR